MTTAIAGGAALEALNALSEAEAEAALLRCCGAPRWARLMVRFRPFHTYAMLSDAASDCWRGLTSDDWRQAFAAHPKIGAQAPVSQWSAEEQAGTAGIEEDVLDELAALNAEYEARFGHIFIICATGRTAEEMLAELKRRIENSRPAELVAAAAEQERITELRLRRILTDLGATR